MTSCSWAVLQVDSLIIHCGTQTIKRAWGLWALLVISPATSKPRQPLCFQYSVTQTFTSVLSQYGQTGRFKKWLNAAPSGSKGGDACSRQGLISSILVWCNVLICMFGPDNNQLHNPQRRSWFKVLQVLNNLIAKVSYMMMMVVVWGCY